MAGFTYEKNLPHQESAIRAVLGVFDRASANISGRGENPEIVFSDGLLQRNIASLQRLNNIDGAPPAAGNIIDIQMETGTGKTYTYAKTMYELHRTLGVFKFVVVVPTLSIKAGTKKFLAGEALKQHFRTDFEGVYGDVQIELYTVESAKPGKGKKSFVPSEIIRFVQTDDAKKIHVLLINAGMVNSDTMAGTTQANDGSRLIKDTFSKPFEAVASVKPFVIVDEPHKFPTEKKTWANLLKLAPQFVLRYGATFNGRFENLVYRLTAVDAFNDDLVKGIRVFAEETDGDNGARITLADLDNGEAVFKSGGKTYRLGKEGSLKTIHGAIEDLFVAEMNKTTLVLSNGVELKRGGSISPYSYCNTVRDKMMRQAVKKHFDLEAELLTRSGGRIKPLTLFFIDDIAGYREKNALAGSLKTLFEQMVTAELQGRLKNENNAFLRSYWQTALNDVSATHGGYFSQDNSGKDEKIEQEVSEILHDKETLLSLNNPRRFIFSKWTLREGWDNPNVFQICKLRSSGSETSKLQEVGRGLRLPVNEYMARVKEQAFFLNYFVDGSERDFVEKLTGEVNSTLVRPMVFDKLDDELLDKIIAAYPTETKKSIRSRLADFTDDNDVFSANGFAETKKQFPRAFAVSDGLKKGKIDHAGAKRQTVKMRVGKYDELKTLWEAINRKAFLQYKIDSEEAFLQLFTQFLRDKAEKFAPAGIRTVQNEIRVQNGLLAAVRQDSLEDAFEPLVNMTYRDFLEKLAQSTLIRQDTLHRAFYAVRDCFEVEKYLNFQTVRAIKAGFSRWLLLHSFHEFQIAYQSIGGSVHPTLFTDENGRPKPEVDAVFGTMHDTQHEPLAQFLFDSVFYDSPLEQDNITGCGSGGEVREVVVFAKIPKNAIKIPVAGGGTYSPDFAYFVKTDTGETLNLVLESKKVEDSDDLRQEENQKIEHAQKMFDALGRQCGVKIVFSKQFESDRVAGVIRRCLGIADNS